MEAQKKNDEKLQKEQEEKRVKERKAALRGVITFAKKVWKELPMDFRVNFGVEFGVDFDVLILIFLGGPCTVSGGWLSRLGG